MTAYRNRPEGRRADPTRQGPEDRYADEDDESYEDEEFEPIPAGQAAQMGLRQAAQLTGRDPSGVTSVQPTEDGWRIGVELVEDHRIPASTDLLGLYEVDLDADGEVLSFRRLRRYQRGKGEVG
ncbi:Gas vesicle synthesis protein GvpO [Micromonospora pallida]|uniref:Gas vesicle synthesis protein GvpO n=1 Tax=Micromonospora pallida TaxID=145854 RepID=A0A1C6TF69_9ACTN|nr:gas vesicle protein [Micromonospora pallida]SCL40242.1 Gas vesicle synthesis protein GvpO [Micromonospora pallida]